MKSRPSNLFGFALAGLAGAVLLAQSPARAETTPGVSNPMQPGVKQGIKPGIRAGVVLPGSGGYTNQPQAQTAPGETVATRPRPQYDPVGFRWQEAGFFVYPDFSFVQVYDTNVFSQESGETDDFISIMSPQVTMRSDWGRHELNFNGRVDVGKYWSEDEEDYEDLLGEATGRYDITRDSNIFGGFRASKRHEDRGSPDDVRGEFPTVFRAYEPQIGFFQRLNRMTVTVEGRLRKFDYDDATTPFGKINNDDRDRKEWTGAVTASYEIVPNYDAFVQGSANVRAYNTNVDDNGLDRDSKGFEISAGTAIDLTGLVFGNVFVGYRRQSYEDGRLSSNGGPGFGMDMTWTPTGLTTVQGFITRTIEETTVIGGSGFFATRFGGSVDHELMRNVLLNGSASLQLNRYEGIDRDDNLYRAATSAKYLLNRNLYFSAGYEYTHRDSDIDGQSFTIHLFLLKLEAQL